MKLKNMRPVVTQNCKHVTVNATNCGFPLKEMKYLMI